MKKTMKKLAAVLLAATMCVGIFAGCGTQGDHEHPVITATPTPEGWERPTNAPEPTQAPDATATPTPTLTPGQTEDVDPEFTVDPAEDAATPDLKKLNALEVTELMGSVGSVTSGSSGSALGFTTLYR